MGRVKKMRLACAEFLKKCFQSFTSKQNSFFTTFIATHRDGRGKMGGLKFIVSLMTRLQCLTAHRHNLL